jgi:hypothetical protein
MQEWVSRLAREGEGWTSVSFRASLLDDHARGRRALVFPLGMLEHAVLPPADLSGATTGDLSPVPGPTTTAAACCCSGAPATFRLSAPALA